MSSLPKAHELAEPAHLSAYNICLKCEQELARANSEYKLRHVRILGFLLLHAPNGDVRTELSKCIESCKDSSDLSDLGEFFELRVIVPFKKHRGRTPMPSLHPSRPSFEVTKEQVKVDITQTPKDHRSAKALALIRDGWKCVVTDAVDNKAPRDINEPVAPPGLAYQIDTECAHIIPESIYFNVDSKPENERKREYSASILAVLKRFGYDIDALNGEKVHSLFNVMSLQRDVHSAFDQLNLYFQSTSVENTYEIKVYQAYPHPNMKTFVAFTTTDAVNLPVPSRQLLDLHATCCKVAHLSGAGEFIDMVYRDADEIGVLSTDGTSGDVLSYMLSSASKIVSVQG